MMGVWFKASLFLFIMSCFMNCLNADPSKSLPQYEMDILFDLYNATDGDNWKWNINPAAGIPWNFSQSEPSSPCEEHWQGIGCYFIGETNHVRVIILSDYNLIGTIPSSLGNMTYLYNLDVSANQIHGSVPETFGNLSYLQGLTLGINSLTGTLPESFSKLSKLLLFNGQNNQFSGTIPLSYEKMTNLNFFMVPYNLLSGTIPTSVFQAMPNLTYLCLYSNAFHGPLPELDSLEHLSVFELGWNPITGTLPAVYGSLASLADIFLQGTMLTGSIAAEWSGLSDSLAALTLNDNFLTSTIPKFMGDFTLLDKFMFDHNLFSGAVPAELGSSESRLTSIYLNNNLLSSSLPTSLSNIRHLTVFFVQYNRLTGPLDSMFDPAIQRNITIIEVSNNEFTGQIPSEVFEIRSLESFAAVSNCLHTSIPESVCSAPNLNTLALDGLSTATACQNRYFPGLSHWITSYSSKYSVLGSVPDCLFNMASLQTLHLSGNEITGTLPSDLVISSVLMDLSLSHNSFYGDIPHSVQSHRWSSLDLSFNHFSGELRSNSAQQNNASLSLQVNRISGTVPHSMLNVDSVNILDGNLFICTANDRSDLPSNDPSLSIYECGSTSFNDMMYICAGLIGFAVAVYCVLQCTAQENNKHRYCVTKYMNVWYEKVQKWYSVFESDQKNILTRYCGETHNILTLGECLHHFRIIALYVTALVVLVCMPVYIILTQHYHTYSNEYAWVTSYVYLSGVVPTVLVLLCMIAVFSLFVSAVNTYLVKRSGTNNHNGNNNTDIRNSSSSNTTNTTNTTSSNNNTSSQNTWSYWFTLCGVLVLNIVVIMGVNIAYVYIDLTYNVYVVKTTQLALSVFKLCWNSGVVRLLLRSITRKYHNSNNSFRSSGSSNNVNKSVSGGNLNLLYRDSNNTNTGSNTNTTNNINNTNNSVDGNIEDGIMSEQERLTTSITSNYDNRNNTNSSASDNFNNITPQQQYFTGKRLISIEVAIVLFNNLAAPFIAIAFVSSSCFYNLVTSPPSVNASYTYQECSLYNINTVTGVNECGAYKAYDMTTSYTPPFAYSYECSSAFVTTYSPVYLFTFIIMATVAPLFQLLLYYVLRGHCLSRNGFSLLYKLLNKLQTPLLRSLQISNGNNNSNITTMLFSQGVLVSSVISMFTLLLTFGTAVPPLAAVCCVALCVYTHYEQLLLGRFVANIGALPADKAERAESKLQYRSTGTNKSTEEVAAVAYQLNRECKDTAGVFLNSLWIAVPFVALFNALILFDMMGSVSDVGWREALWAPITITVLTALIWFARKYHSWLGRKCGCSKSVPHNNYVSESICVDDEHGTSTVSVSLLEHH